MSGLLRCIVVFTILCMLPTTVSADTFYETYQRGLVAFKAKEYSEARAEFLRAYDLRPEPVILFNIAQTYRLEFSAEQALIYYKRFLAESKIAEDLRKEAEAYVLHLETEQAARDAQARIDADSGPKERDGTPVTISVPPMDRLNSQSTQTRDSDPASTGSRTSLSALHGSTIGSDAHHQEPESTGSPYLRMSMFISGGVGIAGIGTGIFFGLRAHKLSEQVSRVYEPTDDQRGKDASRNMVIGYTIGGVGLATCLLSYYFARRAHSKALPSASLSTTNIQFTWAY